MEVPQDHGRRRNFMLAVLILETVMTESWFSAESRVKSAEMSVSEAIPLTHSELRTPPPPLLLQKF